MARGPRLIGLLAAHFAVSDPPRVERLRRLLRSVEEQTVRVPLLASWSAENALGEGSRVFQQAKETFAEFEERGVVVSLPALRGRHSQFQHYGRLSALLQKHRDTGPPPRVFFTDDDDVWHPQRTEEYLYAFKRQPDVEVVASRVHISPGFSPTLPLEASSATVSQLDVEGVLHRSIAAETLGEGVFGASTGEYYDMAISCRVLQEFFALHNDAVLANTFADIRFRTFCLKWPGGVHRFIPRVERGGDKPVWMYYYDRQTTAYSTPASEEDEEYVCDELPDIDRIAGLRQTLDCVLFQLASTEGPPRITSQEFFENLVGMLVDRGPALVKMALHRCEKHGVKIVDA